MKDIKSIINEEIKKIIKERPFDSFNNDEILNKKTIDNYMYNDSVEGYLDYYIKQYNLEDEDEDKIRESEGFKEYIKSILEDNLNDAKENIYDTFNFDGNLYIYRAITVDDNWINHLKTEGKRLGIYWSWNPDSAETHWGNYKKPNIAIIEAEINEKYVNWLETFNLNMDLSLGDENEIRLFKNTPLKIISITINDKEIDLSQFKNKQFYT